MSHNPATGFFNHALLLCTTASITLRPLRGAVGRPSQLYHDCAASLDCWTTGRRGRGHARPNAQRRVRAVWLSQSHDRDAMDKLRRRGPVGQRSCEDSRRHGQQAEPSPPSREPKEHAGRLLTLLVALMVFPLAQRVVAFESHSLLVLSATPRACAQVRRSVIIVAPRWRFAPNMEDSKSQQQHQPPIREVDSSGNVPNVAR